MQLSGKSIILFPEYHLSDFPPQISFTQHEAEVILNQLNVSGMDIIISGYVERSDNDLFSSCLIIDGGNVYNIRKKYPLHDEQDIICGGSREFSIISLSIGRSYFFICNDVTVELENDTFQDFVLENKINKLFLISAMITNFDTWLKRLKEFAIQCDVDTVIYGDRFHGLGCFQQKSQENDQLPDQDEMKP